MNDSSFMIVLIRIEGMLPNVEILSARMAFLEAWNLQARSGIVFQIPDAEE